MKKIGYTTQFLCFLVSCIKEDRGKTSITLSQTHPVHGKWEWFKTDAFFGGISTPQTTGKRWEIEFFPDFTFLQTGTYMSQSMPDSSGKYSLLTNYNICNLGNGTYIRLTSLNMSSPRTFKYDFNSNDTLYFDLGSPCDAPILYFVRK